MSFPGFSDQPGAAERYKYVKALGHGAFGEVVLAEDVQTNQQVAVKQLYLPEPGAPMPQAVARELAALQQVQHPNVIALLDVAVSGCCVYLCQELCCTDLAAVLAAADQQLPPQFVCSIMQQLLAALAACHAAGIMHRDVKPSNILVDKSGSIKLADFGLAKLFAAAGPSQEGAGQQDTSPQCAPTQQHGSIIAHHSVWQQQQQHHHHQQQQHEQGDGPDSPGCHTPAQGTRWYRAPELLFGSRTYGPAVDLWAAGMVFAELLGLTPFLPGQSDIDQLARMQHVLGSITPQAWPAVEQLPDWHKVSFAHSPGQQLSVLLPDAPPIALNLVQQLIRYNPDDRLTAAAALQHAYFACGSS